MPATEVLTESATSKYVQTTKWKLHYNEAGEGHPLILLHGGGAGASGWSNYSRNIPSLARHYRVITIDMPGWGKSDTSDLRSRPGGRTYVATVSTPGTTWPKRPQKRSRPPLRTSSPDGLSRKPPGTGSCPPTSTPACG